MSEYEVPFGTEILPDHGQHAKPEGGVAEEGL